MVTARWEFVLVFAAVAAALGGVAVWWGGAGLLLLWPALSFAVVAVAYAGVGGRVFGKRASGAVGGVGRVALLPYAALAWLSWRVSAWRSREAAVVAVTPWLMIGRRLRRGELPAGVATVVDLTAEFGEPAEVRGAGTYVAVPMLDGSTSSAEELLRAVRALDGAPTPIFVHCALGHGRSGMFAAALLLARGEAEDFEAAVARVRQARPTVRLAAGQWAVLTELGRRLRASR